MIWARKCWVLANQQEARTGIYSNVGIHYVPNVSGQSEYPSFFNQSSRFPRLRSSTHIHTHTERHTDFLPSPSPLAASLPPTSIAPTPMLTNSFRFPTQSQARHPRDEKEGEDKEEKRSDRLVTLLESISFPHTDVQRKFPTMRMAKVRKDEGSSVEQPRFPPRFPPSPT